MANLNNEHGQNSGSDQTVKNLKLNFFKKKNFIGIVCFVIIAYLYACYYVAEKRKSDVAECKKNIAYIADGAYLFIYENGRASSISTQLLCEKGYLKTNKYPCNYSINILPSGNAFRVKCNEHPESLTRALK